MDFNYLSDAELNFELLSRKISPKVTRVSRKIQLEIAVTENTPQKLNPCDWETNYEQLNASIDSIQSNLQNTLDEELINIVENQIMHVRKRIDLINIKNHKERQAILQGFKSQLVAFESILLENERQNVAGARVNIPMQLPITPANKFVPVYKWKFVRFQGHGDPRDINTFLEEIEDLRLARTATTKNVFDAYYDLFSQQALEFCRNAKTRATNWEEFVELLKNEYLPSDFQVQQERKFQNSSQGSENIFNYLTTVESLSKKLERRVSEPELIQVILRGVHPYFASILIASEYNSLEELKRKCKRIHELKLRNASYRSSTRSLDALSGQLADLEFEPPQDHPLPVVNLNSNVLTTNTAPSANANIAISNTAKILNVICWNCNQPNHRYSDCPSERRVFCYACGYPEVYISNCPRCAKSGNERSGTTSRVPPVSAHLQLSDPQSTTPPAVRGVTQRSRGRGRGSLYYTDKSSHQAM